MQKKYAEIALPLPLNKIFHYRVPVKFQKQLQAGMRVGINFGHRPAIGYCVGFVPRPEVKYLKDIEKVIDPVPMISDEMLKLTRWISEYYFCSWGIALQAALPSGVRRSTSSRMTKMIKLGGPDGSVSPIIGPKIDRKKNKLTEPQVRILEFLRDIKGSISCQELTNKLKISQAPVESLRKKNLVKVWSEVVEADPFLDGPVTKTRFFDLTPEQGQALELIKKAIDNQQAETILLHGITGSGKTEVFLQAIDYMIKKDKEKQGIILVPEIALTPQTVRRFRERFDDVAVLHSYLTAGLRADQWRKIRSGQAPVVVGARSAIFAPTAKLGLVVIDEEQEPSFKQQNTPLYHAREVALERARLNKAVVILSSATPSLETFYHSSTGKYKKVTLPQRIAQRPLPPVEIIDLTKEMHPKNPLPVFSKKLALLVKEAIQRKEQVLLFLNRRGFASLVSCARCGYVLRCRNCQVNLTYHKDKNKASCHYCNQEIVFPDVCPECHKGKLRQIGIGTERVEERVRKMFNEYKIARMDSDIMKTRHSYKDALDGLDSGETDILVGTQMIAKGLDFPNVTLVGIISGDTPLHLKDFRAAERAFQLITQVAGRAGRGDKGGRVVVQTFNPTHYSITCGARHDYEGFAAKELKYRQVLGYPPFGRMLRIVLEGRESQQLEKFSAKLADQIEKFFETNPGGEILGPALAPLSRIKGKHRWHLIIKANDIALIQKVIKKIKGDLGPTKKGIGITVDMDPVNLL